jgi:TonB family protein
MKSDKSIRNSLFLTFFIHLILLFFVNVSSLSDPQMSTSSKVIKKEQKIRLVLKDYLSDLKRRKQIVSTDYIKTKNTPVPKETRFLSEKNQFVQKQTRAQNNGKTNPAAKGNTLKLKSQEKVSHSAPKSRKSKKKGISFKDLSFDRNSKLLEKIEKIGIVNGSQSSSGLAGSSDFLPDVEAGELTLLNTAGFKYFGFFNRIREKVEGQWMRRVQDVPVSSYNRGYIRPTKLVVTLDRLGNVISIRVAKSSGKEALDQAAIDSFASAEPFSNPPRSMIKNGKVRLIWGFIVSS